MSEITSLFPGLAALSIEVEGSDNVIGCEFMLDEDSNHPRYNRNPGHAERSLSTFCDDTAFDGLPPDEISDQEEEGIIRTVTKAPLPSAPDMANLCLDEIPVRDHIFIVVGDDLDI
jgi:hypothetical protein